MRVDNILSVSLNILGVEFCLSICWLSIAVSIEIEYGEGYAKELGIGRRFAMRS